MFASRIPGIPCCFPERKFHLFSESMQEWPAIANKKIKKICSQGSRPRPKIMNGSMANAAEMRRKKLGKEPFMACKGKQAAKSSPKKTYCQNLLPDFSGSF